LKVRIRASFFGVSGIVVRLSRGRHRSYLAFYWLWRHCALIFLICHWALSVAMSKFSRCFLISVLGQDPQRFDRGFRLGSGCDHQMKRSY
jgi:hypothetical protein